MTLCVEDGLSLKLPRLMKLCGVNKAGITSYNSSWSWTRNDESYASITIKQFGLDEFGGGLLHISYRKNDQPFEQHIRIVSTTPHYGGKRYWFICPNTGRRCITLHTVNGCNYFYSRYAYRHLPYRCQHESKWDRLLRRYHKRQSQYGVSKWDDIWFPKPKGMHQRTYERCIQELEGFNDLVEMRLMMLGDRFLGK